MRRIGYALFAAGCFAGSLLPARAAQAQEKQLAIRFVPSVRFDLIAGHTTAGQAGLSVRTPISNYFSVGATAGAGVSETGFSGRGDAFARFSLDPYHYNSWEPYFGVGATSRWDSGGPGSRTYLLGFVGFEGPKAGKISPGFELGLGGGVRMGITLRFADGKDNSSKDRK